MVVARHISVPDEASAWERLGFAPGVVQIGGVRIHPGAGAIEVGADGLTAERPDGLALVHARETPFEPPPAHPNGAAVLDHVVAVTDDLPRTVDALVEAGLDLRREQAPMAFLRLGELVGEPKDAVQPGRRIASVRREAGLRTALAFLTPRPQPRRSN